MKTPKRYMKACWVKKMPEHKHTILRIAGFKKLGGGAQEHVRQLCLGLTKLGYRTILVCPESPFANQMEQAGVRVERMELRQNIPAIKNLRKLMLREKPGIVHSHQYYANKRGLVAAKLSRVPFIFTTLHQDVNIDDYGNHKMNFPLWTYNKLLAYIPHKIITVSEATRTHTLAQLKVCPEKVVTVHNGIDLKKIQAINDEYKQAIIKEFNLVPDGKYISIVARLDLQKGHEYLFRAIPLLPDELNVKTLVVGDGYAEDRLKKLALELGIAERVIFTGLRNDASAIVACTDVAVLPSLNEAFGRVILEAMALSKPVVTTNVGGSKEIVEHNRTGILVPSKDPGALASAITKLLTNNELALRMGVEGKKRVYKYFDSTTFIKKTATVYEALYNLIYS